MSIVKLQGESEKSRGIHYELDSSAQPIGVGGMGQVFKGICVNEHTGATRPVAIKFLFDDLPPQAIERAHREASIQLRNDNLVEMLGFIEIADRTSYGEVKMRYHVVSELLSGVSLSALLEGRTTDRDGVRVPFAEQLLADYLNDREHFACTMVINILSGLMALHDAGYIHRDIDPSNIMITSDGHIKLIDFGIAKQMKALTESDEGLTVAGKFMGKPEYAAPELVLGDVKHQNRTTDIYAMGILLYQLVVGHTPFEGPRHDILEQQLKSKLPLQAIKNKALRKIIATACEKKQDLRYQTISEMRVALEAIDRKPKGSPLSKKPLLAAVVAVVLVALAGILYFQSQTPEPDKVVRMESPIAQVQQSASKEEVNLSLEEESKPASQEASNPAPQEDSKPAPREETKPVKKETKPAQKEVSKPAPRETPAKVTSSKGALGYASWTGSIQHGKPVGIGTMVFTASKSIRCSNGKTINAQAGDKIVQAEFDEDGRLYLGKWIKTDGQTSIITP